MASSDRSSDGSFPRLANRPKRAASFKLSLRNTATFGAVLAATFGMPAAHAQTNGDDALTPGDITGVTIDALAGEDTITFTGNTLGNPASVTVSGGADNDSISITNSDMGYSNVTSDEILGDTGNDTVSVSSGRVARTGNAVISGGLGDDVISLTSNSIIGLDATANGRVLGDEGMDTITLNRTTIGQFGYGLVSGGDNNDSITVENQSLLGDGGAGNGTGIVNGDTGDDTIVVDNSYVGFFGTGRISGGDGNDSITISNNSYLGLFGGSTGQVLGDAGDDTIRIDETDVGATGSATVSGGLGDDLIAITNNTYIAYQVGSSAEVLGDDGNDTITISESFIGDAADATISGGANNDSIAISNDSYIGRLAGSTGMVFGDAGNDTITLDDTDIGDLGSATVSGGLGDDLIAISNDSDLADNTGSSAIVLGDAGNDTITIDASDIGDEDDATVSGGDGNDSITVSNGADIGDMAGATGQVLGDAGNDTIRIDTSAVADFGDGTVSGGDGADLIALSGGVVGARTGNGVVQGELGNDTITVDQIAVGFFGNGTVSGGDGNDLIELTNETAIAFDVGSTGQVLGDAGNDTVSLDESVYFGAGTGLIDGGPDTDTLAFSISDGVTSNLSTLFDPTRMVNFEALRKDGEGTLTVDGAVTFADDLTVTAGVIDFTGAGSITSDTIGVTGGILRTDGDAFVAGAGIGLTGGTFDLNGDETIGSFTNAGGVLDLASGVNLSVAGGLTQSSGTAILNGVFDGNIAASGGLIAGDGTINGDVALSGSSSLGPGNSIGTQTINGDLTLGAGSRFVVEVADNQADQVVVNGGVAINGATLVADDLSGTAPSQDFTDSFVIISNDGADAISGSGFTTITDSLAFLDPVVTLNGGDGNDVELGFKMPPSLSVIGLGTTRNQRVIANSLDDLLTRSDATALIDALSPLTFAELDVALDELSGVQHAVNHYDANSLSLFLAESVYSAVEGSALQSTDRAHHAFLQVLTRRASVDADGVGGPAADASDIGVLAGLGRSIGDNLAAGVHLAYVTSEGEIDIRASDAEAETLSVGVHMRFAQHPFDLTGSVSYAESRIDTDRTVRVGTLTSRAQSDYQIDGLTGSLEAGYSATISGGLTIRPYLGVGITESRRDGFAETGAGVINLAARADGSGLGYAQAGVRTSTVFETGTAIVEPYIDVSVSELTGNTSPDAILRFAAGSPDFRVFSADVDQSRARLGLGASLQLGSNLRAGIDYRGQFADNADDQALRIGLTVTF